MGRQVSGNRSAYVIGDARLWSHGTRSVHAFARITASPEDRNLVSRYFDAGIAATGAIASRPRDVMGLAIAVAQISRRFRANDPKLTGGNHAPAEIAIEANYQMRFSGVFYLQPNAQLIASPYNTEQSADAGSSPRQVRRALVIGIRTSLRF
jgi:porin